MRSGKQLSRERGRNMVHVYSLKKNKLIIIVKPKLVHSQLYNFNWHAQYNTRPKSSGMYKTLNVPFFTTSKIHLSQKLAEALINR